MKILIQGRKNGYTVLYPKPTPTEFYSFARDIQSINANNYDDYYGKNFYTLAFVDGGCIFTKYVIGDDVERGQLGEIGISVFISNTQKLSGADVKNLLDELINTYNQNYIIRNKIEEPKNGFDWFLFTAFADSYDVKSIPRFTNNDNFKTGTQDPAFHYYKSESELIEYLDKPFQEEYNEYKQILFIDSRLQGVANPLNVLKNSGVEVNPDLKNEYYYLKNYSHSKDVTIRANGKLRSDKKGENQIRAKWQVEIKYSKNDICYEPINAHGTISDLSSEIYKYIEIRDNHIMLKYDVFNNPTEKIKRVTFEIKDYNGKPINGADIQIGTRPWEKVNESSKTISFHGEDILRKWSVSAKKESENLYSESVSVIPDTQCGSVKLTMQKQKIVHIVATDKETGDNIPNFKIWYNDGKGYCENVTKITFLNDDIDKTWIIQVSKKDGLDNYSGKIEYCPATGDSQLYVPCQKTTAPPPNNKRYKINAGEYGKKVRKYPSYSNSCIGNDIDQNCIIANKGYVFTNKWELQNDTLVAQYEKRKFFAAKAKTLFSKPVIIASSIVGVIVLVILLVGNFWGKDKHIATPLTSSQIKAYVEGDSLMLDELSFYKENWQSHEQDFITKSGGGIFGGEQEADSTKWKKDWKPTDESIERAITKRKLINNGNFLKLKNQHYSEGQSSFKTVIDQIDTARYTEVGQNLSNVSTLTLPQIADSIDAILARIKQEESEKQAKPQEQKKKEKEKVQEDEPEYITRYLETSSDFELDSIKNFHGVSGLSTELNKSLELVNGFINGGFDNCDTFKRNALNDKFLKKNTNLESWVNNVCKDNQSSSSSQANVSANTTSEIIQYIKGSELDVTTLKKYQTTKGITNELKNSIQLCIDFWALDGSGSNNRPKTYWTFLEKVKNDQNLKESKLKTFLDEMCQVANPSYSDLDKIKGLKGSR